MTPQPTDCAMSISLSYQAAVTPLTDQFALYNLLKDLWTAYLSHQHLRHLRGLSTSGLYLLKSSLT